jgi:N-acetylneuraminic acid mutarotase
MKYYKIKDETLTDIADAIREKTGSSNGYSPVEMAAAIRGLETGGGAALNIAYGDTAPEDTSVLWVKAAQPQKSCLVAGFGYGSEKMQVGVGALQGGVWGVAYATVGKKLYMFGGSTNNNSSGRINTIRAFDMETEVLETLDDTLPNATYLSAAAAVGNKIYLFGGYGEGYQGDILVFDTVTQHISKVMTASLPYAAYQIKAVSVGTKVFLFGEYNGSYKNVVRIFDAETETLSALNTTYPLKATVLSASAVGTDIYLFGGRTASTTYVDTICKFDTQSLTFTTLNVKLPIPTSSIATVAAGKNIYLFGGRVETSVYLNTIRRFDVETYELSTIEQTLPIEMSDIAVGMWGTRAYLASGNNADEKQAGIHSFAVSVPLEEGTLAIEPSLTENITQLFSGDSIEVMIGVANVYRGNADGVAEKVAAAVYKDGVWKEI